MDDRIISARNKMQQSIRFTYYKDGELFITCYEGHQVKSNMLLNATDTKKLLDDLLNLVGGR